MLNYMRSDLIEYNEKIGYIPNFEVVNNWSIPIEEYNRDEHKNLLEAGITRANLKEIRPHSKIDFKEDLYLFPISVTHSIPDSVCYVLYTKDGAIVYTGDYIIDCGAFKKFRTDLKALARMVENNCFLKNGKSVWNFP